MPWCGAVLLGLRQPAGRSVVRLAWLAGRATMDAVVIAGDWVYDPPRDLQAVLAPFSRLRHPVWAF